MKRLQKQQVPREYPRQGKTAKLTSWCEDIARKSKGKGLENAANESNICRDDSIDDRSPEDVKLKDHLRRWVWMKGLWRVLRAKWLVVRMMNKAETWTAKSTATTSAQSKSKPHDWLQIIGIRAATQHNDRMTHLCRPSHTNPLNPCWHLWSSVCAFKAPYLVVC